MADILTPALGESVTEATIGKWTKQAGDAVKKGQPVAKSDTRVHFEVRRANKTLDPLTVLPAQ